MADKVVGLDDETPLVQKEAVAEAEKTEEEKLERPVFPWQKKGRQTRTQSLGSSHTPDLPGPHLPVKGTAGDHTKSHDPVLEQSSQLASLQELFLQQQKQMQEQFRMSLQNQLGGAASGAANSSKLSSVEEDRLRGELKNSQEHVKELEEQLEVEKAGAQVYIDL